MGGEQRETTVELISVLISLSLSIRVFSGRWQLIRNKLEDLRSSLTAGDSHSFSGLFPAIATTVEDCHEQAKRCLDLSYSGKLLMQSDLDAILGKLEGHVKKFNEIHRNGILSNGYAVVVSKSGLAASKLTTQLQRSHTDHKMEIREEERRLPLMADGGDTQRELEAATYRESWRPE